MESQQVHTPRKTSRPKKTVTNSDQGESSRRGGRRGGRSGSNTHQKHSQSAGIPQTVDGSGTFDENGNFVPDSSTPQHTQRSHQKRSGIDGRSAYSHTEHSIPVPVQHSPFAQSPFLNTPPKQYYAGPAFHQSPAASALPMPRFLSKSMPKAGDSAPSLLERARKPSDSESSSKETTPEPSPSMSQTRPFPIKETQNRDSPLNTLFEAARAEKAKHQQSLKAQPVASQAATVKKAANTPSNHWASIYGNRPSHQRTISTDSSKGLFPMDLENKTRKNVASPVAPIANSPGILYRTVSDGMQHIQQNNHGNQVYTAPTPVEPIHILPRPTARDTSLATSQAPVQHFSQYTPAPKSVHQTPIHTPPSGDTQSQPFHYGNKNLSPMFQAARSNSPRTQSQLRNQVDPMPVNNTNERFSVHGPTIPPLNYNQYDGPTAHKWNNYSHPHPGQPINAWNGNTANTFSRPTKEHSTNSVTPVQEEDDSAKMQLLTDNLRNMLKIPRN